MSTLKALLSQICRHCRRPAAPPVPTIYRCWQIRSVGQRRGCVAVGIRKLVCLAKTLYPLRMYDVVKRSIPTVPIRFLPSSCRSGISSGGGSVLSIPGRTGGSS